MVTASGTYSWSTAADWSNGLPGTGSVACITKGGTYTVQLVGGTTTIDALELGSGTSGDQETLDLFGTCSNNATLDTTNTVDSPDFDTIASTGQLFMGTTGCGDNTTLGIGTSLDESSGGLIETDNDVGGARAISGGITNDGTVNIDTNTTYSSGTWDNAGPLNIATGETLTFSTSTPASAFTDDTGGSVSSPSSGTGQLVIDSGNIYNQGNGTTSDEPVLLAAAQTGPTIAVHYTGTGASTLLAEGQETVDGGIASGQTLEIAGACSDNAVDTDDASLTNQGIIDLTSTGCGDNSQITVATGDTLTNDGTLETVNGAGGSKAIVGNVTNGGTVDIGQTATYESGTWDNKGALNISDGETLTVATATPVSTFTNDTSGSVTSSGTSQTGQLIVDSGNTYNQGNGTTSGEPVLLEAAQTGPTIAVHYTGTGASTLLAEGQETVDGSIASGQTLDIAAACSDNAVDTEDASLTNHGIIQLTSTGCGDDSQLTVATGDTLTNDGTLETVNGVGGSKAIVGNVTNRGTADIEQTATYESGTWDNKGALNLSTGETLTVATATPVATFTNDTGGSITSVASGTGQLVVDSGNKFNQDDGTTTGEPVVIAAAQTGPAVTLNYGGDASAGASTIQAEGEETLTGSIQASQNLDVTGACSDNAVTSLGANVKDYGSIVITSAGCGDNSTLAAPSGKKLTIEKTTGQLTTVNGVGGTRAFSGNIKNKGTVTIDVDTTYTPVKRGEFKNKGTVTIASAATLNMVSVKKAIFLNSKGTITGSGQLVVNGKDTFQQEAGTIPATPVLVDGATLDMIGTGAGAIDVEGTSKLEGNIANGQTVNVVGYCSLNAVVTGTGSMTNSGTLDLTNSTCSDNATFALPVGDVLTNAANGVIETLTGVGSGTRTIQANITNDGTIGPSSTNTLTIDGNLTDASTAVYDVNVNTGSSDVIAMGAGDTAALAGTMTAVPVAGFTPSSGYSATVITGTYTGTFSSVGPAGWSATYPVGSVKLGFS